MNIDYLTTLPADIVIKQLTYLPFDDVIKTCSSNSTLHSYCLDSKYNNKWKSLIDDTYKNVYEYDEELDKLWTKLNFPNGTYNYLVYTQLIKLLDPITQLMIYYLQGDMKSFNDKQFNDTQRLLTMFLLNKPNEMIKYNNAYLSEYLNLLKGTQVGRVHLDEMLNTMAEHGNIKGVKYLTEKGANIHNRSGTALSVSAARGHLNMVKYLVERGATIDSIDDGLEYASEYGHLDIVKYLIEKGANIRTDVALKKASENGHWNVVRYLIDQGANIHVGSETPLIFATRNGNLDMVKYLVEKGADVNVQYGRVLRLAQEYGYSDIIKYLSSKLKK